MQGGGERGGIYYWPINHLQCDCAFKAIGRTRSSNPYGRSERWVQILAQRARYSKELAPWQRRLFSWTPARQNSLTDRI